VGDAIHGIQALQSNNKKPQCIFLDLNLPFMDGFHFLDLIKNLTEFNSIPVIVYSTSSRAADIAKAKDLGAFTYLFKETSPGELKAKLTELLNSTSCIPG
jgi:CheY-like chemotaxis protein